MTAVTAFYAGKTIFQDSAVKISVKKIVDEGYKKALDILEKRKDILEKAVVVLLEKEKIDGEELKAIIEEHDKNPDGKSD